MCQYLKIFAKFVKFSIKLKIYVKCFLNPLLTKQLGVIMVAIKPFHGLRYNKEKVKDFSLVITPPYDVINEQERDKFYKKSPYNLSRITLAKGEDKYEKAANLLDEWIKQGVIVQDKEDCIYIYVQTFKINGEDKERMGFISLLKIEDIGKGVLDHEKTMAKPVEDRLNLMNATFANLGQIFILYDDRQCVVDNILEKEIEGKEPDMDFGDDGIRQRLWKITNNDIIKKLTKEMEHYQVIIADGHHRYKTRRIFRDVHPGLEDAKYSLSTFVNSFHGGMFILPTNRLVKGLKNVNKEELIKKLEKDFTVELVKNEKEMISAMENTPILIDKAKNLKNHLIGMYCNIDKTAYILKLKNSDILNEDFHDKSDSYKKLDANVLHKVIFDKMLAISEKDQEMVKVEFVKGNQETINKLKEDNSYQFGFFLNPPLMREVFLTARANELMPQKSTFFYPKLYSGIVIYKMKEA